MDIKKVVILSLFFLALLLLTPLALQAAELNSSVAVQEKIENAGINSQNKIDKLAEQNQSMLEQYKIAITTADSLQTYNDYLEKIVQSQTDELNSFDSQIEGIEKTTREVVPLMGRMLKTLEEFVKLDVPFLPKERATRLATLTEMMAQANVSTSEKFRRILEAYQVETEYGRTIEAYRAELDNGQATRSVDFLRIGRVALLYQTLDGKESGHWNQASSNWEVLPKEYYQSVRTGLNIARKRAAPDLIKLPISAPEAVR